LPIIKEYTMAEEILKDLGLSMNESKVFLALIELGQTTVGNISKKCKVHRTNVYDSLGKLESRDLVICTEKQGTKYFDAKNPEELMNFLKKKQERLQEVLPQFLLDYKLASKNTKAHIFEGVKAIHDILEGFLNYKEPVLVYGVPKEAPQMLGDWLKPHHKKRVSEKIMMKHIYNEDAKERIKYLNKMPYTEAKYLPNEYNSPVSTEICGEEVIFIFWKTAPIVVHIKSKEIADYYKKYFEILWRMAKNA
jgi:sugar-specific transcriptional regulator TrmB